MISNETLLTEVRLVKRSHRKQASNWQILENLFKALIILTCGLILWKPEWHLVEGFLIIVFTLIPIIWGFDIRIGIHHSIYQEVQELQFQILDKNKALSDKELKEYKKKLDYIRSKEFITINTY